MCWLILVMAPLVAPRFTADTAHAFRGPHSLLSPRPLLPPLLAGLRGHLGRSDRSRGAPGKLSRHPGAHGCQQNSTSRRGSVLRAISGDASRAFETGRGVWRSGGARSPCFSVFFQFLGTVSVSWARIVSGSGLGRKRSQPRLLAGERGGRR